MLNTFKTSSSSRLKKYFLVFCSKSSHQRLSTGKVWRQDHVVTRRSTIPTDSAPRNRWSFRENGYILLTVPLITFGLGTWQVQRRKWKLNLIAQLEERTTAPPVPFPDDLSKLEDLEYRHVTLRGSFDHSAELYVMPRSPVSQDQAGGGLISSKSKSGAYVITAFKLKDSDKRVLVNRGWVPRANIQPDTRPQGQVEGEIELCAIVRKSEKRAPFGGKNDAEANHWQNKNSEEMAAVLNTEPIMLDANLDSTVPGGPVGGQTRVTLRNEHLSYIITWYSLSALTFLSWYRHYWLRK